MCYSEITTGGANGLRCFLRDLETGKFFKAPANWTDNLTSAHEFGRTEDALRAAQELAPEHMELVFANARCRIVFGTRLCDPSNQRVHSQSYALA